jgi:hypothetical protein
LLKINSRDSNSTQVTNPIKVSFLNLGNRIINSIDVKSVSIPNVFYNVSTFNNLLQINFNTGAYILNIVLPPGQYSMSQFINALNQFIIDDGTYILTFAFDPLTNKIYTLSPTAYTFNISSMFSVLGLDQSVNFIGVVNVDSYFPNFPDLSGPRNIYIKSNIGNMNLLQKQGHSAVIAIVPVIVGFSNIIHYSNFEENINVLRSNIYSQNLSNVELELTDVLGNILSMAGMHWEITFKCISSN